MHQATAQDWPQAPGHPRPVVQFPHCALAEAMRPARLAGPAGHVSDDDTDDLVYYSGGAVPGRQSHGASGDEEARLLNNSAGSFSTGSLGDAREARVPAQQALDARHGGPSHDDEESAFLDSLLHAGGNGSSAAGAGRNGGLPPVLANLAPIRSSGLSPLMVRSQATESCVLCLRRCQNTPACSRSSKHSTRCSCSGVPHCR